MSLVSGGTSGAITDIESPEAKKHAIMYYEEIRHLTTDVKKIAENTGLNAEQVLLVKNYLFVNEHLLGDEIKRFDPSFAIAESWRRLAFDPKNIQPHDITLLKHELKEMELVSKGVEQSEAHLQTSKTYNYHKESDEFYEKLGVLQSKSVSVNNSGGINRSNKNWEERC